MRLLVNEHLEHWLAAAATDSGFFRVNMDRQWRPVPPQNSSLVSQSRLIYVMACGDEVTGKSEYKTAARRGADFLLSAFPDRRHGMMFFQVDEQGGVVNDQKIAYGHAFAIFGLSHAFRCTGDKRYLDASTDIWRQMQRRMAYEKGGFRAAFSRDFGQVTAPNSQNPLMHLFEALLALHDAGGGADILRDANALAEFIYGWLYDERLGRLPEQFEDDWRPAPDWPEGRIDLGHQFEWAFLLSRAVEKGFAPKYLDIASRLLEYGMKYAYDAAEGGIFSRGRYDGVTERAAKGWWQQAEHLRTLAHFIGLRGRSDLLAAYQQSWQFAKRHFIDGRYGGWFAGYTSGRDRTEAEMAKGNTWKAGYHETGMFMETLRQL
jgi:mannose/cellobiose epimerase-like protein (N-acyl-D-glucosamine 2-epimerase family)